MKIKYPDVKIKTFPDKVMKALKEQSQVVLQELANESPLAKEITEHQKNFSEKMRAWTDISEKEYMRVR